MEYLRSTIAVVCKRKRDQISHHLALVILTCCNSPLCRLPQFNQLYSFYFDRTQMLFFGTVCSSLLALTSGRNDRTIFILEDGFIPNMEYPIGGFLNCTFPKRMSNLAEPQQPFESIIKAVQIEVELAILQYSTVKITKKL